MTAARTELIVERRQVLAGAEMAALCALCARRGLASPYGGEGYVAADPEQQVRHLQAFEETAVGLMEKAEALQQQIAVTR